MPTTNVVKFNNFSRGIADSPFVGIGAMQNAEIFESPGALKISHRLENYYTYGRAGTFLARVRCSNGDVYELFRSVSGNSSLFKNGAPDHSMTGRAWDMVEYDGFLVVSTDQGLNCFGTTPATQTTNWLDNFITGFTNAYYLRMLIGQDGFLYITNGQFVAQIDGLNYTGLLTPPTTNNTDLNALKLKSGQYAVTIEELGKNIMVGTQAGSSWEERGARRVANIYPWNRQPGTLGNPGLADIPVKFNECGIHAMLAIGNLLYVCAGTRGNIYVTDGTSCKKIKRLPWTTSKSYNQSINYYPNAIFLNSNNNLLIGISVNAGIGENIGVYEMSVDGAYAAVLKQKKDVKNIGYVSGDEQDSIIFGWGSDDETAGTDRTNNNLHSDYSCAAESEVFYVGTAEDKRTFQFVDFLTSKPLTSSQGVKILYRTDLSAPFTELATFEFDGANGIGAKMSFQKEAPIADAEIVELKAALTQDNSASPVPLYEIELLQVRIW